MGDDRLGTVAPTPSACPGESFLSVGARVHKVKELHHRDSTVSTVGADWDDICGAHPAQPVYNPVTSGFT
jgi:hypothetical protein